MVKQLHDMDLLYPETTYIHCNYLSDEEFRLIAESGGTDLDRPERRDDDGARHAAGREGARRRPARRASASTSSRPCPATCSRRCGSRTRRRACSRTRPRSRRATRRSRCSLSTRDVLEFATIEGARVCGLEDRTGSLAPGKQADVVMIRCDDTNTYPLIDPVSTVVLQADTRNVDTVFVAGRAVKRAGTLVDADLRGGPRPRRLLARVPPRPHDRAAELGAERGAHALSRELPSRAPQPGLPAPGTYSLNNQVLTRAFSLPTLARTVQKTGFAFELRRAAGQIPGGSSATLPDWAAEADRLAVQGRCSRGPESPKEGEA